MRQFINKYGYVIAIVAVVIAGLAVWLSTRGPATVPGPTMAYYVDEETGEESVQDINAIPPLPGKSGRPTLVLASKYTCDGGKTRTTYMLSKYAPEVAEELRRLPPNDEAASQRRGTHHERTAGASPGSPGAWLPANSPKGMELAVPPNCPDGQPGEVVYP